MTTTHGSTTVDERRCSVCHHAYHRGPCRVTVRSPLVEPPNGDFSCACPPDADWPGEDDDECRHPAYWMLVTRYREARRVWATKPEIREAAETLGMSERAYCDRFIQQAGPVMWTSSSTTSQPITQDLLDTAFAAAEPADERTGSG